MYCCLKNKIKDWNDLEEIVKTEKKNGRACQHVGEYTKNLGVIMSILSDT